MMDANWPYPGARWWRFDFHTHTPASRDSVWPQITDAKEQLTPEEWLLKYMEAEIDCVAVTDHNTGEWIDRLKEAYGKLKESCPKAFRELFVFPGVEISVQGGVHLLAILDTGKGSVDIDMLLGRVEYEGTRGDCDGATRKSLIEVVNVITELGGLAIPAHADQKKGLLRLEEPGTNRAVMDAATLKQVFDSGLVLAVEWVDPNAPKPQIYTDTKVDWTEVIGSDCENFQGSNPPGSRFTWVKMGRPSLEGLRLALHDGPSVSIRRSDEQGPFDPFHTPDHLIESIEISQARYMGRDGPERLRFNPWLNALVGGRGTGKSTIIHALRLAYRRDSELKRLPENDPARRTYEDFVKEPRSRNDPVGALDYQSSRGTKVTVTLKSDTTKRRLQWRQDGEGVAVEEEGNGKWKPDISQSVTVERYPVRIFSQGQIASLAGESQQALVDLVDEGAKTSSLKAQIEEGTQRFLSLRAQMREISSRLRRLPEVRAELTDAQRKLALFEEGQHAEILKEYQLRQRQNREMARQLEDAVAHANKLRQQATLLVAADVPPGLFNPDEEIDREALAIIDEVHAAIRAAGAQVLEAAERLEAVVTQQKGRMAQSQWMLHSTEATRRYKELAEKLKAQGVADPSEYGKLVQERQRLEGEIRDLESLQSRQNELVEEGKRQRHQVRDVRREITTRRQAFIDRTLAGNPYVKISLVPYGQNARTLERELREILAVTDDRFEADILMVEGDQTREGVVAELASNLPQDPASAGREFDRRLDHLAARIERAASGLGDFGGHFNNYLRREGEKHPEVIDRVLVWSPEDSLNVEYSPKGDGKDFRSIQQASAGQRAAAMLAFLLAYGDEPLVLDQPEDDLDNHLIYELVVRQVRANKLRRQLIVVTHNPNIVVNGDAELVHAFDFTGGQCRVIRSGCLQERDVREEVCRVMEGGREAFERRYRRLGKEI